MNKIQQQILNYKQQYKNHYVSFIKKDNEGQEQVGEPMAATVNEKVEYNMEDIKEMILEAFNNIKKGLVK